MSEAPPAPPAPRPRRRGGRWARVLVEISGVTGVLSAAAPNRKVPPSPSNAAPAKSEGCTKTPVGQPWSQPVGQQAAGATETAKGSASRFVHDRGEHLSSTPTGANRTPGGAVERSWRGNIAEQRVSLRVLPANRVPLLHPCRCGRAADLWRLLPGGGECAKTSAKRRGNQRA